MAAPRSLGRRLRANLAKKWLQVLLSVGVLGGAVYAAARWLGPAPPKPSERKNADVYRFLHCDQCHMELPFSHELDGKRCPRCPPPKTGFYVATKTSLKAGGDGSPWRRLNIAVIVLVVGWLAAVLYLLSRPVEAADAFVHRCHHCGGLIRYWRQGFGGYAQCPDCRQLLKLPDEDEAQSMADLEDQKTLGLVESMEHNLRATGTLPEVTLDDPPTDPRGRPS